MLEGLKNWLRERFEREEYFEYMTGQDPSSPAWLIMMAVGGALYALNLIFPALAKAIAAVLVVPYLVYLAFIWAAAKHRPDDWDEF